MVRISPLLLDVPAAAASASAAPRSTRIGKYMFPVKGGEPGQAPSSSHAGLVLRGSCKRAIEGKQLPPAKHAVRVKTELHEEAYSSHGGASGQFNVNSWKLVAAIHVAIFKQ